MKKTLYRYLFHTSFYFSTCFAGLSSTSLRSHLVTIFSWSLMAVVSSAEDIFKIIPSFFMVHSKTFWQANLFSTNNIVFLYSYFSHLHRAVFQKERFKVARRIRPSPLFFFFTLKKVYFSYFTHVLAHIKLGV